MGKKKTVIRQPRNKQELLELVKVPAYRERLLKRRNYTLICGQVCVAIMADVTLDDALRVVGFGITRAYRLTAGLNALGKPARVLQWYEYECTLPERAIVRVDRAIGYDHWLIKKGRIWLNPRNPVRHCGVPKSDRIVELIQCT